MMMAMPPQAPDGCKRQKEADQQDQGVTHRFKVRSCSARIAQGNIQQPDRHLNCNNSCLLPETAQPGLIAPGRGADHFSG